VSSFAKSKTLKQQREFLPIYAVREKVGIPLYLNVCPVYWEIAAFSQSLRPLTLAPPLPWESAILDHPLWQLANVMVSYSPALQLLSVIRDNSVVVIVGETGSGKTTQLTQVSLLVVPECYAHLQ